MITREAFTLYRKHVLQLTLHQTDPGFLFVFRLHSYELLTAAMTRPFQAATRRTENERKSSIFIGMTVRVNP